MNTKPEKASTANYDDFQVARGEFFSHICEPSLTFSNYRIYVNTVCLKKLPEYDYIKILINPKEKILAIKPCQKEERDSLRWRLETKKEIPRKIGCKLFFAKVMTLMNWNYSERYRLLGKILYAKDGPLLVFNLNSPEIYKNPQQKAPVYPEDWKLQFGMPAQSHPTVQIHVFDQYSVFGLPNNTSQTPEI